MILISTIQLKAMHIRCSSKHSPSLVLFYSRIDLTSVYRNDKVAYEYVPSFSNQFPLLNLITGVESNNRRARMCPSKHAFLVVTCRHLYFRCNYLLIANLTGLFITMEFELHTS